VKNEKRGSREACLEPEFRDCTGKDAAGLRRTMKEVDECQGRVSRWKWSMMCRGKDAAKV
jgi:hypothetical protein